MLSRCRVAFADVCQMVLQMDERLNLDLTIALLQFVPKQEEVCMPSLRPCINIGDTNNVACSSMPFVLSKEMWRSSINPNNLSVPSWYVAHTHTHHVHNRYNTDTCYPCVGWWCHNAACSNVCCALASALDPLVATRAIERDSNKLRKYRVCIERVGRECALPKDARRMLCRLNNQQRDIQGTNLFVSCLCVCV
jgi:hypothetical protein